MKGLTNSQQIMVPICALATSSERPPLLPHGVLALYKFLQRPGRKLSQSHGLLTTHLNNLPSHPVWAELT